MLSRRHLRIKALQSLYAFIQSHNDRLDYGEKELLRSLDKLYEIYIYQLSLLVEIVDYAKKRIEENSRKFYPTEEDLNPNTRFVDNRVIRQLTENKSYNIYVDKYKISWVDEEEMIRKLFIEVRDSKYFREYMNSPECSYEDDKEILIKIVKKIISESDSLHFYYEEKNIYWADDFYTANYLVIKTIKGFDKRQNELTPLPTLFKNNSDEDREFLINLFRKVILRSDEYFTMIEKKVKNWESDRLAVMDILLLKMALAELLEFPSIPIKVTLNEYIELSKMFSTPKSKVFINGILDKMISELKRNNEIKKTGRGLLEN
jgi:N utilization substance protein B